ncbi:class I SAM-dependent DNA methyltransferase [Sinisalibacter lacisalsi]|uniref:Methyltransferase n=1 Tax=Sinisalibacter lacisalsi TaxID=1526570 RepID=A0ABQ1QEJ4_9RHOB|nr:class I SAM-dependent methyltransferase [Sinisalibacter lacisalsi]GGD23674.1 methyltransferase [Sinisalibacter lacisalsi]
MTGADPETITAYETRSRDYAARTGRRAEPGLAEFVAGLPRGGHVLDLGCGPGDSAHRFLKAGFTVDAIDASPAMVSRARELGVPARCATFDEIEGQDLYDGIWASYSLLHAPRADMPGTLARLHHALKPGGLFHIGMKTGTGEARDSLGRLYVYYSEPELIGLLQAAGFSPTIRETRTDTGLDGTEYQGIWMHANG